MYSWIRGSGDELFMDTVRKEITMELVEYWKNELDDHRKWLSQYSQSAIKPWENLLKSQPEAAICEAILRHYFASRVDEIEPNEPPGPDFICTVNGGRFYIEVTCLTRDKVTEHTELTEYPQQNIASYFRLLTNQIYQEAANKVPQCSKLAFPCLLAEATLHYTGAKMCFRRRSAEDLLTGTTTIIYPINTQTGDMVGQVHESADLRNATYIRPAKDQPSDVEFARKCFSGIILCDFGSKPVRLTGTLHPQPKPSIRSVIATQHSILSTQRWVSGRSD